MRVSYMLLLTISDSIRYNYCILKVEGQHFVQIAQRHHKKPCK